MNNWSLNKIALLTALLVEEVRNAKGETKYNYDSINGKWKRNKKRKAIYDLIALNKRIIARKYGAKLN